MVKEQPTAEELYIDQLAMEHAFLPAAERAENVGLVAALIGDLSTREALLKGYHDQIAVARGEVIKPDVPAESVEPPTYEYQADPNVIGWLLKPAIVTATRVEHQGQSFFWADITDQRKTTTLTPQTKAKLATSFEGRIFDKISASLADPRQQMRSGEDINTSLTNFKLELGTRLDYRAVVLRDKTASDVPLFLLATLVPHVDAPRALSTVMTRQYLKD